MQTPCWLPLVTRNLHALSALSQFRVGGLCILSCSFWTQGLKSGKLKYKVFTFIVVIGIWWYSIKIIHFEKYLKEVIYIFKIAHITSVHMILRQPRLVLSVQKCLRHNPSVNSYELVGLGCFEDLRRSIFQSYRDFEARGTQSARRGFESRNPCSASRFEFAKSNFCLIEHF